MKAKVSKKKKTKSRLDLYERPQVVIPISVAKMVTREIHQ